MNRRGFLGAVLGLLAAPIVAMVPEFKEPAKKVIAQVDPMAWCKHKGEPLGMFADGTTHLHNDRVNGLKFCMYVRMEAESKMYLAC